MDRPPIVFEWSVAAIRIGDGRYVRSLDGFPKDRPIALRLLDRLRAFGYDHVLVDLADYRPPWLPDAEADALLSSARTLLEKNDYPYVVRNAKSVSYSDSGWIDARAWAEHWLQHLPPENGDVFLFLSIRSLLVPPADLDELRQGAAGGGPRAAHRSGYPWESAGAYHRAYFDSVRREGRGLSEHETLYPKIHPVPNAFGGFDLCLAYFEVIERLTAEAPVSWTYAALQDLRKKTPTLFHPVFSHVGVEATNEENLPNRLRAPARISRRPVGRMEESTWARLLDECRVDLAPLSIDFWDLGEPLLHPRVPEWIEAATRKGIRVDLFTNGLLLDAALAERLIHSGIEAIFVRLDAARAETYLRVSGGDAATFERAMANLAGLEIAKRRANEGADVPWKPWISAQCTEMPETAGDLDAFLHLHDHSGRTRDRLARELRRAPTQLEIWRALYETSTIEYAMIRHDNLYRGRVQRGGGMNVTPLRRFACRQLFEGPFCFWNGEVAACREDTDIEHPIGRVEEGLLSLWRGPALDALRSAHIRGEWEGHALCGTCAEWYYPFS